MSKLINALNKVNNDKLELKSEVLELGIVDDIKKLKDKFEKDIKPVFKEISKKKSDLMTQGKKAEQEVDKASQAIEKTLNLVEKAAKDLGVDVKTVDGYSSLKSLLSIVPDMKVVFKSVQ